MPQARIAIIGDTAIVDGEVTDAGAIAIELARGWRSQVEVGFRSVAASGEAWEALDARFGEANVTTWLTIRHDDAPEERSASDAVATVRMGDPLNIDELFSHDLVIVATRHVALRRFLADLPVHTYPGVRMLSLIHFREGVPSEERLEDLLRFDVIAGAEVDFRSIMPSEPLESVDNALAALAPAIRGTNVRAAISWGKHGAFRCVTGDEPVFTLPPHHAPPGTSDAPWAAFVAAVAIGLINRQGWEAMGREASRRFAIRAQEQVAEDQ